MPNQIVGGGHLNSPWTTTTGTTTYPTQQWIYHQGNNALPVNYSYTTNAGVCSFTADQFSNLTYTSD